jgi:hypothetical protein
MATKCQCIHTIAQGQFQHIYERIN